MRIPLPVKYLSTLYLLGIGLFFVFRLVLVLSNYDNVAGIWAKDSFVLFQSFFTGLRFDASISGYLLALPLVVSLINYYVFKWNKTLLYVTSFLVIILYVSAFAIQALDIPFFNHFYERLNASIFLWQDNTGFAFDMLLKDKEYLWSFILFLAISGLFIWGVMKLTRKFSVVSTIPKLEEATLTLVFATLLFFSIRGKTNFDVPPLDTRDAYFSRYSFANKVALNPVFTLLRSYLDALDPKNRAVELWNEKEAVRNVQKYLNVTNPKYNSPIARYIEVEEDTLQPPNVILVLMESMTIHKMGRYGNRLDLTPHLDSIAQQGLTFDNVYSAGIHTYNGIFSTLFSFPAIYRQQPLKTSPVKEYYGLPHVLKEKGYHTQFYITHDEIFDNMGAFLRANNFDDVFSEKDYPRDKIVGTWGVSDDFLFEFGLKQIKQVVKGGQPFFATFLTCSDHAPYHIPDYFSPKSSKENQQIVEYADWSIGKFLAQCREEDWFNNTVFVFIADHGQPMNVVYDMPLSFHQTPMIFYAPQKIKPKTVRKLGLQIDLFPTLMGMLGFSYINNTLGVDLQKSNRPFAFFSADNKIGVVNDSLYLIIPQGEQEKLYNYSIKSTQEEKQDKISNEMKKYTFSHLQTTQFIVSKNLQKKPAVEKNNK